MKRTSFCGEPGSTRELKVLATLIRSDIHYHQLALCGETEAGAPPDAIGLAAAKEAVSVITPFGMKRGQSRRSVHIQHNAAAVHFDSVLGVAGSFTFENAEEAKPDNLLQTATSYVETLVALCSPSVMQSALKCDITEEDHRPLRTRQIVVVDATGNADETKHRREDSVTLQALHQQIAALTQSVFEQQQLLLQLQQQRPQQRATPPPTQQQQELQRAALVQQPQQNAAPVPQLQQRAAAALVPLPQQRAALGQQQHQQQPQPLSVVIASSATFSISCSRCLISKKLRL